MATHKHSGILFFFSAVLFFSIGIHNGDCHAKVVNSIVARVNDHIITLRDIKVEYNIQKKIIGEEALKKKNLLWEMIDDHLLLSEKINKVYKGEINSEQKTLISDNIGKFKGLFKGTEYIDFLADFEITEEDIFARFRKKALVDFFLKQNRTMLLKDLLNANGAVRRDTSTTDTSPESKEEEAELFQVAVKSYVMGFRKKADIIINIQPRAR